MVIGEDRDLKQRNVTRQVQLKQRTADVPVNARLLICRQLRMARDKRRSTASMVRDDLQKLLVLGLQSPRLPNSACPAQDRKEDAITPGHTSRLAPWRCGESNCGAGVRWDGVGDEREYRVRLLGGGT